MQYKLTVFMLPSLSLIYGIDLLLGACAYCSDCMYIYNYMCLIKDMYLTNSIFIPISYYDYFDILSSLYLLAFNFFNYIVRLEYKRGMEEG